MARIAEIKVEMEGIKTNIKKIGDTWKPYKNEAQNKTSQTDSKAINSYTQTTNAEERATEKEPN